MPCNSFCEAETRDNRGMEFKSKPGTVPRGLGRMSAMSGSPGSDPLEKLHSDTDSFLTAARLARRGWSQGAKTTQWQSSSPPEGNQGPRGAERSRRAPDVSSRKMAEDREKNSEQKAKDEAKPAPEGAFFVIRPAERQTKVFRSRAGGCRTRCRRRFSAPILPVIAEV